MSKKAEHALANPSRLRRLKSYITQSQVVGIATAIIVTAILLPVAFNLIFTANTSGWSTTTVTIWVLVPVLAIVGIILALIPRGGK